jgi:rfaE bifunctional protein nucleotidyltransferase chain/domain
MENKIFYHTEDLLPQVRLWKANQDKIVFTNGCFDLIHLGHVEYLKEARALGTKLIVGLNSDASVTTMKGSHRPVNDEKTRMAVLSSFYFVDAVVLFSEDTPLNLIKEIVPHVLVKGGDWAVDQIVGSDLVISNGGEVSSLSFHTGYSSTNIENKIIEAYKNRTNEQD